MLNELNKLLKSGKKLADYVQINASFSKVTSLNMENNSLKDVQTSDESFFQVKVWVKGKEGAVSSSYLTDDLIKKAVKTAKHSKKTEYFHGLPSKIKYSPQNNFDTAIENLSSDDYITQGNSVLKEINKNKINLSQGSISSSINSNFILNSEGVCGDEKSTNFYIFVSAISKNKKASYYDARKETMLFDPIPLAKRIRSRAEGFLNAKKMPNEKMLVTLSPRALSDLLGSAFLENFNGKDFEKGKSIFSKLNDKLFSNFDMINTNKVDGGLLSSKYDFEGTPARETVLVKEGVLKNLLYDFNTAKHNKKESTSSATSDGIGTANIILKGKSYGIKESLYVDSVLGAHTSNSLTTDFGVKVEHAFHFVDDRLVPIQGFFISGKMIEVLANVISISKEIEQRDGIYTGALTTDKINVIK